MSLLRTLQLAGLSFSDKKSFDFIHEIAEAVAPVEQKVFKMKIPGENRTRRIVAEKSKSGKWWFDFNNDPCVIVGTKVLAKAIEGWKEIGIVDEDVITLKTPEELSNKIMAPEPQNIGGKIIYARGFPYGAPLVMVRGGATRSPIIKQYLKSKGFVWDSYIYAWKTYLGADEFLSVLKDLHNDYGCVIKPKNDMDSSYIFDLFP